MGVSMRMRRKWRMEAYEEYRKYLELLGQVVLRHADSRACSSFTTPS